MATHPFIFFKIYQVDQQVQDEKEIMALISGSMALKGH